MKSFRILLALLACAAFSISANAQLKFSNHIEVRQQSYAEVSVVMDNNEPIRGFQFDITLPEGIEAAIEKVGDTNHLVTMSKVGDVYRVLGYSMDNSEYPADFGAIVKVWFTIPEDFPIGEYTISMHNAYLSSSENSKIPVPDQTASLTVIPKYQEVKYIELSTTALILYIGQSATVTATVYPLDATDKTLTWSSDNPDIATVDANGVITALAPGEAYIRVTASNGVYAVLLVQVWKVPAESVTLNKSEISLLIGESETLIATVSPDNTTDKAVTWASSNASVATVTDDGKVTAVGLGTATITATCGSVSASCEVTVKPIEVEAIALDKTSVTMRVGQTATVSATVSPSNATYPTLSWTSSDEAVATVDANGMITALALGQTTVTATATNGVSASLNVTVEATPAEGITLDKASITLKVGESDRLTATVTPADATDKSVTWTSSNEAIATVDADGQVTAIAVGAATITATCGDKIATCEVTVKPIEVEAITLDKTSVTMRVGQTATVSATVSPSNATYPTLTWTSTDTNIATVDAQGVITALTLGQTTVTATATNGVSASLTVTVEATPAEGITLDKASITLKVGETDRLIATVTPADATDKSVTWTSSNEAIATVDADGQVTAVAVGTATITATCGDKTATCEVTVKPIEVEAITLDKTAVTMRVGQTATVSATVSPSNATYPTLTWTSADINIATVDAQGVITALALGQTTVTATATNGVSASLTVTVEATPAEGITLDKASITLKVGESDRLTATVTPADATDKSVTWTSSDEAVATVDADGQVTAVAVGTATITATCEEVSATCEVTVEDVTGVSEIESDDAERIIYNLQGIKVDADKLQPGYYIIRQGSKTYKVFIR